MFNLNLYSPFSLLSTRNFFHRPSLFFSLDYLTKKLAFIPCLLLATLQQANAYKNTTCGTYTHLRSQDSVDYCVDYNKEEWNTTVTNILLACGATLQNVTKVLNQTFTLISCSDHSQIDYHYDSFDPDFYKTCLSSLNNSICPPESNNGSNDTTSLIVLGLMSGVLLTAAIGYRLREFLKANAVEPNLVSPSSSPELGDLHRFRSL